MRKERLWRIAALITSKLTLICFAQTLHAASCEYTVLTEWNSGFSAEVTITNTNNDVISGWSVSLAFTEGSTMAQAWNAQLTGAAPYIASNVNHNAIIPINGSVTFGFNGNKNGFDLPAEIPLLGGICVTDAVNHAPVAVALPSTMEDTIPFDVIFDATESFDEDGDLLTYLWDFGNGDISTEAVVTRAFDEVGSFPVSLIVNDGSLDSDAVTITITASEDNSEMDSYALDPNQSSLFFVSTKQENIPETHYFTNLSGAISTTGLATLTIDLDSVETGISIRNERLRNLLFETGAFPQAVVTLPVDLQRLSSMAVGAIDQEAVSAVLSLHGVSANVTTTLNISKLSESTILVQNQSPIIVQASDYGLIDGISALRAIAGLTVISHSVPTNFTLLFKTP